MTARQDAGRRGEDLAHDLLARHGLRCLARNYRVRGGEIDLVCEDRNTVVFVEVRWRAAGATVSARESVDARKRARLTLAARRFLQERGWSERRPARFDVVAITPPDAAEWIRAAFDAA
jgi:putative endonuclease